MSEIWVRILRRKWRTWKEKGGLRILYAILIFLFILFGIWVARMQQRVGYSKSKVDTSTCSISCMTADNLSSITLTRLNKSDCHSNVNGEITTCLTMLNK